jgi:hypothetical protein
LRAFFFYIYVSSLSKQQTELGNKKKQKIIYIYREKKKCINRLKMLINESNFDEHNIDAIYIYYILYSFRTKTEENTVFAFFYVIK